MRSYSAAVLAAITCASYGQSPASMERVSAAAGSLSGETLYVAGNNGGVTAYSTKTRLFQAMWPTMGKVRSLLGFDGGVCWSIEGEFCVYVARNTNPTVLRVDFPETMLNGPVVRLGAWDGAVVVSSATRFAFLPLDTLVPQTLESVLPVDVARIAAQGMAVTYWNGNAGLFVSVRRYGRLRTVKDPMSVRDVVILNGWSFVRGGRHQRLGGYTCPLVDLPYSDGPTVAVDQGRRSFSVPFGAGPMANVMAGPEGVVGLGLQEVRVVPMFQDSWVPNTLASAFRPNYSQTASYCHESVWWTDYGRVFRTDLTDGSSECYVPEEKGVEVRGVVADADGAWVLTGRGVRRIEMEGPITGYTVVAANALALANSVERSRLQRAATTAMQGSGTLSSVMRQAGMRAEFGPKAGRVVEEAQMGDLIVERDRISVYMGGGKVLVSDAGRVGMRNLDPTEGMEIRRVLNWTPLPKPTPRADPVPAPRVIPRQPYREAPTERCTATVGGWIYPIGVNSPKLYLGTSEYVRAVPGASFDHPYLPAHQRLIEVAKSWLGTPYRWGGNTRDGVDCSGFVTAVYRSLGINLPRHSQNIAQVRFGQVVKGELHFGDVLVYQRPKHVAIYIGDGRTVETVRGGVGFSTVYRRSQAIVRRFLF